MSFLLAAAIGLAGTAYAVQPASEEAIAAIQDQIQKANRLDFEIGRAKLDRDRAKIGTADYVRFDLEYKRQIDRQMAEYTKAVHMTIKAYDLPPANQKGQSAVGWTAGREVNWVPIAHAQDDREVENAAGKTQREPQSRKSISGRQYLDGVAYIDPSAFRDHSVGWLASTILHEHKHFEQLVSKGRGDVMSAAALEDEAYDLEIRNFPIFFDYRDPHHAEERVTVEGYKAEKAAVVAQEEKAKKGLVGYVRSFLPRPSPPDFFDAGARSGEDIESLKRQAGQFSADAEVALADVKARAEAARRREEAREARDEAKLRAIEAAMNAVPATIKPGSEAIVLQPERPALPIARDPINSSPSTPGVYTLMPIHFVSIARSACAQQSFETELNGLPWGDFRMLGDLTSWEAGLSPCELRIFRRLIEFGRYWSQGMSISVNEVNAAVADAAPMTGGGARRPEQSHDPVRQRLPFLPRSQ